MAHLWLAFSSEHFAHAMASHSSIESAQHRGISLQLTKSAAGIHTGVYANATHRAASKFNSDTQRAGFRTADLHSLAMMQRLLNGVAHLSLLIGIGFSFRTDVGSGVEEEEASAKESNLVMLPSSLYVATHIQ